MNANFYKQHLQLQPHPEGGAYRRIYQSEWLIPASSLPANFKADRPVSTSIYFLLEKGDFSSFHKIKSDECWHFYAGGTLHIHVIEERGRYYCRKLGAILQNEETFQLVVPAGAWFAAEPANGTEFALTGCTVAPGFDFEDFTLAEKSILLSLYPQHQVIINRLCR